MKNEKHPTCYIVAGPNGAGKTTYALKYLPAIASCKNFLNVDEIAKGLSPLDFNAGLVQASRIFLSQLTQKIRERKSFAFETTLSGRHYLQKIRQWRKDGWNIILIYLYIPTPEFSEARVRQRVEQGGHDIPLSDIYRRYPRSLKNLFEYMEVCDKTFCIDNSASHITSIFEKELGHSISIENNELYKKIREFCTHE